MWDNPAILNRVTRMLLLAVLLFALAMAGRQAAETWLPVREVTVSGAAHLETRRAIRPVLAGLSGGLFAVDLAAARRGFEALPWVRSASVRRIWPHGLAVTLEERVPAAAWNDLALLDVHGEVFAAQPWPGLPRLSGPDGMAKEAARRYGEFASALAPGGWRITAIQVDARHTWTVALAGGPTVELGHDRLAERLKRFVAFYPLAASRMAAIRRVDMRYPNGFAVQGEVGQNGSAEKQRT